MKKFLLFFALLGFVSVSTVSAQKSCTAKKMAGEKVCTKSAAAKLASIDNSIESRVCEKSGSVSYVRKDVCSASGKVSFQDVEFCSKSGKFVNLSPSKGMTKKACTKGKAACTKKAATGSAMKVSQGQASAGAKKACCKKGAKTSCTKGAKASTNAVKAKMVKNEE